MVTTARSWRSVVRLYFTVGVGGLQSQWQTTGLICVQSLFTPSTGGAHVITVLWSHMGSSQLHGQMVSCSIQAGAGLLCLPGTGPCVPLVDLRLYCQVLESPLLLPFSDCLVTPTFNPSTGCGGSGGIGRRVSEFKDNLSPTKKLEGFLWGALPHGIIFFAFPR